MLSEIRALKTAMGRGGSLADAAGLAEEAASLERMAVLLGQLSAFRDDLEVCGVVCVG